jgi:hypothetical protein
MGIFENSMGIFEGSTSRRKTPFEADIPRSRGGGPHMAFNRVKIIPGTDNFVAVHMQPFPGSFPGDIRSMGPYELPDYAESHSSAEGIGQIPGIPGGIPGVAPTTPGAVPAKEEPWYQQLLKAGGQIYQTYTAGKKPATPAVPPPMPGKAFVYSGDTGMSTATIIVLVGGGVIALGVLGYLLLRK